MVQEGQKDMVCVICFLGGLAVGVLLTVLTVAGGRESRKREGDEK